MQCESSTIRQCELYSELRSTSPSIKLVGWEECVRIFVILRMLEVGQPSSWRMQEATIRPCCRQVGQSPSPAEFDRTLWEILQVQADQILENTVLMRWFPFAIGLSMCTHLASFYSTKKFVNNASVLCAAETPNKSTTALACITLRLINSRALFIIWVYRLQLWDPADASSKKTPRPISVYSADRRRSAICTFF